MASASPPASPRLGTDAALRPARPGPIARGARSCAVHPRLALLAALWTIPAPAAAHDWYEDLRSPAGDRCCTGRDCQPVAHRYNQATHRLEVGIEGVWVPVDSAKLVAVPSPDGAAHACFERHWMLKKMTPIVRCIILPGEV